MDLQFSMFMFYTAFEYSLSKLRVGGDKGFRALGLK